MTFLDAYNKYLLTHLANGRFVIKPNITQQGVLYYGNSNGEEYKEHFKTKYYPSGNNVKELHDELMYHNVLLEQFALLVKTFPLLLYLLTQKVAQKFGYVLGIWRRPLMVRQP